MELGETQLSRAGWSGHSRAPERGPSATCAPLRDAAGQGSRPTGGREAPGEAGSGAWPRTQSKPQSLAVWEVTEQGRGLTEDKSAATRACRGARAWSGLLPVQPPCPAVALPGRHEHTAWCTPSEGPLCRQPSHESHLHSLTGQPRHLEKVTWKGARNARVHHCYGHGEAEMTRKTLKTWLTGEALSGQQTLPVKGHRKP